MNSDIPRSTARVGGHPIHPMLVPFPIAFFSAALLTDIAYAVTADMMWADFSDWLLAAGFVIGCLAALAGLVDFAGSRGVRRQRPAWPHMLGNLVVLGLALLDNLVHSRDAWTSVVPEGLILSAAIVIVMAITGWLGASLVYRHAAGVEPLGVRQ